MLTSSPNILPIQKRNYEPINKPTVYQTNAKKYPNTITDDIFNGRIKYALEGYLYPATYSFYEESPPLSEIIETMIKKTDEMLVPYRNKMKELSLSTHQFLTLASLVEEEATEKADREK